MDHIEPIENKTVRIIWNINNREWYFVIIDTVQVLTKSCNPSRYIKGIRRENKEFAKLWFQIVSPLEIKTSLGKQKMNCTNAQGILKIILSIPSPKVEPFKQWIVKVGLDKPEKIKNIAFYNKRTKKYKGLLHNPEAWIDKQNRTIFHCEDLYLQGKLNDLELIIAMLWDNSLMDSFETNGITKSNHLLCPERKK